MELPAIFALLLGLFWLLSSLDWFSRPTYGRCVVCRIRELSLIWWWWSQRLHGFRDNFNEYVRQNDKKMVHLTVFGRKFVLFNTYYSSITLRRGKVIEARRRLCREPAKPHAPSPHRRVKHLLGPILPLNSLVSSLPTPQLHYACYNQGRGGGTYCGGAEGWAWESRSTHRGPKGALRRFLRDDELFICLSAQYHLTPTELSLHKVLVSMMDLSCDRFNKSADCEHKIMLPTDPVLRGQVLGHSSAF